jgi:hypothetical protein
MHGFDTCQDPSQRTAKAWWTNTPWSWIGLYVGGSEMACSQPNLSSAYLNNLHAMGWRFQFIWVGPQAPCTGFGITFSSNTTTAHAQGMAEARAARSKLIGLGITNQAKGSPLVFDLEAFNPSVCNALAAARAFVQGWVDQLHAAPAQSAGVYGSTCASQLQSYAGSHQPDFIWGANYDGNQHTSAMSCVSSSSWASHRARRRRERQRARHTGAAVGTGAQPDGGHSGPVGEQTWHPAVSARLGERRACVPRRGPGHHGRPVRRVPGPGDAGADAA